MDLVLNCWFPGQPTW